MISRPPAPSCRVPFLSRWAPEHHLWGVMTSGPAGVMLDQKAFDCCGGDGIIVSTDDPRNARLCGLSRRWHLLGQVIRMRDTALSGREPGLDWLGIKERDSRLSATPTASVLSGFFQQNLDRFLRADRGRVVASGAFVTSAGTPGDTCAWSVSAALAWHFEVLTLTTRIGTPILPIGQWSELIEKFRGQRAVVIIDGVSELWHANRLESMEAIISFASERGLPVWLFESRVTPSRDVPAAEMAPGKRSSFRAAVSKRLASFKEKPSVEWLSAQARSRLSELCQIPEAPSQTQVIPDFV